MTRQEQEDLLRENDAFILRTASQAVGRTVTRSDDEYSIALSAFWEAVQKHDPEKGTLQAYASVVIRNRLIDDIRSRQKYSPELSVSPAVFGEDPVEGSEGIQQAVGKALQQADRSSENLKEEIESLSQELKRYKISFFDLPDCCPKASKTRAVCLKAARFVCRLEELLRKLRKTLKLPSAEMETGVPIARKLLDKFRKYIITSIEILAGDFPGLQEYFAGKEES